RSWFRLFIFQGLAYTDQNFYDYRRGFDRDFKMRLNNLHDRMGQWVEHDPSDGDFPGAGDNNLDYQYAQRLAALTVALQNLGDQADGDEDGLDLDDLGKLFIWILWGLIGRRMFDGSTRHFCNRFRDQVEFLLQRSQQWLSRKLLGRRTPELDDDDDEDGNADNEGDDDEHGE
ncbi:hypothetical protein J7T55_000100, partial [Diaporthe amygdali]|uniref:uncharacterized protein n=1 Tax=Phomopsis amygdali TaxID=1214568 RepID=UPI0022FE78E3